MTKTRSIKIIKKLKEYYGKVNADLSYINIYQLTIAVVLSAHTTDKQVNLATAVLFQRYPDFQSMSKANIDEVESIIKSVGLFRNKAKNIIILSKQVVNDYNNKVPDKFEELIKLSGVGRKSANVILSMGYGKEAFPVDTHILRIANRLGYIKTADPYKVEQVLTQNIPPEDWRQFHLLFIKHGRKICKARNPSCEICPVNKLCDYAKK